jgi:amidase
VSVGDISTWPAERQAAAIRDRSISSRELLDIYLDRIESLGGPINAVVTLDIDRARAAAEAADAATARGDLHGPLHGLPITIKDAIETEGIRSTGGAVELTNHVPAADAPAVAALKDAGAIVFGKTNLPRWSGDLQSYNEIFGTTSNPWNTDHAPGGSSGGAAAAVACGFTSFELGTDIGGSVRIPSHFCGVFGLKPSFGVVPQRGYLDHPGGGTTDADINVFGPIARSAADLDLLLGVLVGPPPEQRAAWSIDLPPASVDSISGLRAAVWIEEPMCTVDAPALAVLRAAVDRLADAGAKVSAVQPPVDPLEQSALFGALILPAISPSLDAEDAEAASGSHLSWLRLCEKRVALQRRWAEWFADWDVLLCPVSMTAAIPHQHEGEFATRETVVDGSARPYLMHTFWTGNIGVAGLPSAVPPIGRTEAGLPVGIQVVAPYLHDRTAVRVAGLVAEVVGGYEPPPGFA